MGQHLIIFCILDSNFANLGRYHHIQPDSRNLQIVFATEHLQQNARNHFGQDTSLFDLFSFLHLCDVSLSGMRSDAKISRAAWNDTKSIWMAPRICICNMCIYAPGPATPPMGWVPPSPPVVMGVSPSPPVAGSGLVCPYPCLRLCMLVWYVGYVSHVWYVWYA